MEVSKPAINPLAAGAVGAVIGATATGSAILLSNRKNRAKLIQKAGELKDQGLETFHQIRANRSKLIKKSKLGKLARSVS